MRCPGAGEKYYTKSFTWGLGRGNFDRGSGCQFIETYFQGIKFIHAIIWRLTQDINKKYRITLHRVRKGVMRSWNRGCRHKMHHKYIIRQRAGLNIYWWWQRQGDLNYVFILVTSYCRRTDVNKNILCKVSIAPIRIRHSI